MSAANSSSGDPRTRHVTNQDVLVHLGLGPRPLRILHLFANFKWTGPADPAIRCAHYLRRAGADVVFAQARWIIPGAEHWIRPQLRRWRLPVTADLQLRKHFHPPSQLRDIRVLRARLQRGDFDVLHCHLPGDHFLAAMACRRVSRDVTIVRSLYDPDPPKRSWRNRLAFRGTAGVVAPTRRCADLVRERFGLAESRVLYQEPATEAVRDGDRAAGRAALGLSSENIAVGITARIQPHRRFELLWETARRVVDAEPNVRFVLLGRGNPEDTEKLVREPVERLGLARFVMTPGYLQEPDYSNALSALDVFFFLVPGSDGTCRAVREAMAMGLPVVSTRLGMLPDILDVEMAEPCGFACQDESGDLAAGILTLVQNEDVRQRIGEAARLKACEAMNSERAAANLLEFYDRLRGRR